MDRAFGFILVLLFTGSLLVSLFVSVGSVSGLVGDSWVSRAPMSQARDGLGVVAVDGKIYAIGGSTENHRQDWNNYHMGEFVGTNECYNPATDTWTTLADMPTPRSNFAIAVYQGKIYCIGGINGTKLDDQYGLFTTTNYCNIVEVYDTATDSWSTKTPMPGSSYKMSASVADGKIYAIRAPTFMCYDPVLDTWTDRAKLPTAPYNQNYYPVSVVLDNKFFFTSDIVYKHMVEGVIFGPDGRPDWDAMRTLEVRGVFVYDPMQDVWCEGETRERIVHLGGAGATTGVYAPKRIYVMGEKPEFAGELEMELAQGTNRIYDVASDSWSDGARMLTPRLGFGIAVVDDILYVVGGRTDQTFVSAVNEAYIPIGYSSVAMPTPSEPFFKYVATTALVLTAGATAIVSAQYFKKQRNNREKSPQLFVNVNFKNKSQ